MAEIPNGLPPLGLPAPAGVPPLRAMRAPRYVAPIPANRGREVAYENLVPGTTYYLQRGEGDLLDEFEFLERIPQHHSLRARYRPALRTFRNRQGNPMAPVYEPMAPGPLRNAPYELQVWPHYRFYEINKIKRTGRFLDPTITRRAKQQAITNSMARRGLPTGMGTGPVNTILNYAGLRPPRRTRGGKRRGNKKTRKQRGGALQNPRRVSANVIRAVRVGLPPAGEEVEKPLGSSNLYYAMRGEDDVTNGFALIIGPRSYVSERFQTNLDKEVARYPFEECLFLFSVAIPDTYPVDPPKFLHQTPRILNTPNYRIHPNLYEVTGRSDNRKTCLGILNTYGEPEWNSQESVSKVLEKMVNILYDDPGTFEPMTDNLYRSILANGRKNRDGVAYNQHSFAEALEYTCAIYKAVINAVNRINADYTAESPLLTEEELTQAGLPEILRPFANALARRAFDALNFLTAKVESFISFNQDPANPLSEELYLEADRHNHKQARTVDFGELKRCLDQVLESIPRGLQKFIVKPTLFQVVSAAYSRNHREGETLAQFAQRLREPPIIVENGIGNEGNAAEDVSNIGSSQPQNIYYIHPYYE